MLVHSRYECRCRTLALPRFAHLSSNSLMIKVYELSMQRNSPIFIPRYKDDLLNIDNPYFTRMVGQIYPPELQLNKANPSDTEAPFLDLNLSITNGIVSSKIYDKWDDLKFEIVKFPFLDGDVPHSPSYGVYISKLIRFARVCSNVDDFNNRNLFLTAKLLKQGYRYHRIRKAFSKFYHRYSEIIVKYNIGLKTLLPQCI